MNPNFLLDINYTAVAVSAISFFFCGSLWFSVLFGKAWVAELGLHNVTIKESSQKKLFTLMGLTFLQNIIVSFAMALLVYATCSETIYSGLLLGCIVALGFSAMSIAGVFIWEGRSVKLFLIDAGYQMAGSIISAVILSVWR